MTTIIATLITAIVTLAISFINGIYAYFNNRRNRQLVEDIELLKASLTRENVSFQIFETELIKRRFDKMEALYSILARYADFQESQLTTDVGLFAPDAGKLANASRTLLNEARASFTVTKIYLTPDLKKAIDELLKNCERITLLYLSSKHNKEQWNEFFNAMKKIAEKLKPLLITIEDQMKMNLRAAF